MTYGYGDPNGGWPPSEPDPAARGRRRAADEGAGDDAWQSERTARQPYPPDERGGPPPTGVYGSRRPAVPAEPAEDPRYGQSHLTDRFVRRDGPSVTRPPADGERGWEQPRPPGRPPQGPDEYDDRARRGYADPPGQRRGAYGPPPEGARPDGQYSGGQYSGGQYEAGGYGDRPARVNQYGVGAPVDPRTRPTGAPPRPRTGDDYYDDERPGEPGGPSGRVPGRKRSPWTPVLAIVATVALLAVCGFGLHVMFFGGKPGPDGKTGATVHDISNQTIDPAPLTVAEVFPAASFNVGPATASGSAAAKPSGSASASAAPAGLQPYQVVKSDAGDCKNAVVGDLITLLANAGCTQVVRATLLTADQQYVITTGLFNLRDATTAKQVNDGVRDVVGATKGRFTGFMAGGATDVIGRAKTQLAWDTRGHFLLYCVIARADGADPDAKNPAVTQMVSDLVEAYLNETVLTNRTLNPPAVPSSDAPSVPASSAH